MITQIDIKSYIAKIEKILKTYERSWKKEIKTTNAEIMGALPLTRSNDARIRKMITNTESILSRYAADLISKLNDLDEMGQEYRQGVVEDEVIISIVNTIQNAVDALKMKHTLEFPKQTQTVTYTASKEVTDLLTRWKRIRSTLPTVKIQKIEESLMQKQSELESCLSIKNNLEAEAADLNAQIAKSNDNLIVKKTAADEALAAEEEAKKNFADITAEMNAKIAEYDTELYRLETEKDSVGLDQATHELSNETATFDADITICQNKIGQLNSQLQQQKIEEELAQQKSEKAFFFKNKKLALASEMSAKVVATQAELESESIKLDNFKAQKEQTIATINAKISAIQLRLDMLNSQITIVSKDKKTAEDTIIQERRTYDEIIAKKEIAEIEYESTVKNISSLEKKLKKVNKSTLETESQIQTLYTEIEGYNQEIAKIRENAAKAHEKAEKRMQSQADSVAPQSVIKDAMDDIVVFEDSTVTMEEPSHEPAPVLDYKPSPNMSRGRPAHDRTAIIDELKRRYPNGSEFTSADELFAANPDLLPKLKTLKNTAKESFGMTLGKYLLSIGLINSKTQPKEEELFDYEAYLKNFVLEMKRRLEKMDFVPTCTSKLPSSFADMDFKLAKKCVKKIYGEDKSLDQHLQESRVLNMPASEDIEMLDYVEILKTRYQKAECLPTKLGDLIDRNPDLPIRKLNKYIREVIGEVKTEKYYIRNHILQGKETDLIEYDYCEVELGYEKHPFYYISTIEDLRIGDNVIVNFGWHGKIIGKVISITTCIGLDAPWPVSQTSRILRKARDEETKNNAAHWTDEDKWLYEWRSDDSHEEYMVNNISAHIPSAITYLEGKRALIKLIQNEQAANSMFVSSAYDKSMLPSFLFDEVGLKGGTYSESQRLYAIITRVHNTGRSESVKAIEQLNNGETLLYEYSNNIHIKNKDGISLGYVSNDIAKTLIPMLNMQYAIIKDVEATYIRPLSKMNSEKKHPALYVMLLIELADMTEETKGGASVVLYGNDWKARATKATLIKTTVPSNIAYVIFNCPYNKTFEEYCKEMFGPDSQECKLITNYTQNTSESGPTNSIYDLFWRYAVDETTRYWFDSNEVDYATWDANTAWGFNHWNEKIILVDDYDDPSDAFHGFGLSTIILSEG